MNFTEKTKEAQDISNSLVQKCWEDGSFKKKLICNPVETIEEFTGQKYNLPENKVFKVIDQSDDNSIYLNIPRKVELNELELTEEELEKVSGGEAATFTVIALGIAACAIYDFACGFAAGVSGK